MLQMVHVVERPPLCFICKKKKGTMRGKGAKRSPPKGAEVF